jgi:ERF superfamily
MNMQSDNIAELITAMSKAQGEIRNATKTSLNPHFKSKYADLSEVWEACREPLSRQGLAVLQTMGKDEQGTLCLITTLAHSSGQWIKSIYPLACKDHSNPQAWGSSITYARRYTLSSIVGIAPDEDDDGNKASALPEKKSKEPKFIDKTQWAELNKLIEQCNKDYQKNIWDYLESQNILSFEQMNENMFNKLKKGCLGNIEFKDKIHAIN